MGNKRKGQLTTDIERHKHLRKIGKRFFWKGERITEKKVIQQDLTEFETQTLTEYEVNSAKKLYDYLDLKIQVPVHYEDLYNLYYSLFCTLVILPENLRSLKFSKEVLALSFVKLVTTKKITQFSSESDYQMVSLNNITDENHWIEQISICMRADKWPNYENARALIGTCKE